MITTQLFQQLRTTPTCVSRHVSLELGGEVESLVTQVALKLALTSVTFVSLVGQEGVTVREQGSTRVTHVYVWRKLFKSTVCEMEGDVSS